MTVRIRERDALGTAVLVSILLHVVLLNALPGWREWQGSAPPMVARLLLLEQSAPERAADVPQKRDALLPQASTSLAKPSPKRFEPKREESRAMEALTPSIDAPEHSQDFSRPAAEPSASAGIANVAAPGIEPISPPPAVRTADAGTIGQYRLAIISRARDFNRYPRLAVENNWQGRAEVRMSVGADGTIASLVLRSGSGHEILDRQALDMIGQAAPQVALPAALRGREFVIDIPVIFSLNEVAR